MKNTETIVISVGGSLIVPDQIDTTFLKKLKKFILQEITLGKRFVIIAGGGKTCRRYQQAAEAIGELVNEDLDWLGIHTTRLNGHLLRTIFHDIAFPALIKSPHKKVKTDKSVIIAAGWKPGWSTDYVAVRIAKNMGAKRLVNLSNIDYAYDKDPNKFKDAVRIKEIDWKAFRTLLPTEWTPGLSAPFDPIAAAEADKSGIEVAIINGSRLAQVEKYLEGKAFTGTKIA